MKIFLSYASENRSQAEEIALGLQADGHEVFFDRSALAGGEDFHAVIREQIAAADLFLFLITPQAVDAGSYTLTELRMARERWPHPGGRLLPVLLEPTEMADIPAYARSVTLFEAEGNAAAEIAALVAKRRNRHKPVAVAAAAVVVIVGAVFAYLQVRGSGEDGPAPFVSQIEPADFVRMMVFHPDDIDRLEYALDPTSPLAVEGEEMVRLESVAFGELELGGEGDRPERATGFSVEVSLTNASDRPILLDLGPRFFELADDQGRQAELLYFCCETRGEMLAPGARRNMQLIYRSVPGWEGKELSAGLLQFKVRGLRPLLRGAWGFAPLATGE